jgi:hypothetical protein
MAGTRYSSYSYYMVWHRLNPANGAIELKYFLDYFGWVSSFDFVINPANG